MFRKGGWFDQASSGLVEKADRRMLVVVVAEESVVELKPWLCDLVSVSDIAYRQEQLRS